MTYRGNTIVNLPDNSKNIKFQVIDWVSVDQEEINDNEEELKYDNKKYVVKVFGVTKNGSSISVNINDYPPHYYVNIPEKWRQKNVDDFIKTIKSSISFKYRDSITSYDVVKRKKFWGFTNNKIFTFIRILFKNTRVMFEVTKCLKDKIKVPGLIDKKYDLYESNITPFIRFIHINNLLPAGWIELKPESYTINNLNEKKSECQIDIDVHWKKVCFYDTEDIAPFITASFDIEADSSHGDFPLPIKNYKKLSTEIL